MGRELGASGLLLITEEQLPADAGLELSFAVPAPPEGEDVEYLVIGRIVEHEDPLGYRVEFVSAPAGLLDYLRALRA
jgi:hypothetical protein